MKPNNAAATTTKIHKQQRSKAFHNDLSFHMARLLWGPHYSGAHGTSKHKKIKETAAQQIPYLSLLAPRSSYSSFTSHTSELKFTFRCTRHRE
jgi:hypothetical protein